MYRDVQYHYTTVAFAAFFRHVTDARWPVCPGNSVGGLLVADGHLLPMPIHGKLPMLPGRLLKISSDPSDVMEKEGVLQP